MNSLGYKILIEVLGHGDIERMAEAVYVFQEREDGKSKITWKQYKEYIHHLLRLQFPTGRLGRIRQRVDFPIGHFIRFVLVGFSGRAVDMGTLYLLYNVLGLGLTRSAIFAAEVAIINNFSETTFGLWETFQSIRGNGVRFLNDWRSSTSSA